MSQVSPIALELLERVKAAGGRAWLDGEMVRLEAPVPLPDDLRAALRAHKAEVVAALRAGGVGDPEVLRRVKVFRAQMEQWPRPVPLLRLPDIEPRIGTCLSCGGELPQGRENRCDLCVRAAHIVLDEMGSQ